MRRSCGRAGETRRCELLSEDAARAEIDAWLGGFPSRIDGTPPFFTVIRRDNDRRLCAVPYHSEYGRLVGPPHMPFARPPLTAQPSLARHHQPRVPSRPTSSMTATSRGWKSRLHRAHHRPAEVYEDELF